MPTSKRPTRKKPVAAARCGVALSSTELRGEHQRGVVLRLKRAEGQIRGVLRMIEAGESCDDIAQQLAAARTALDRAFFEMMACSLESEIVDATDSGKRHERVSEILRVLSKYA
ncbi:MAG TPA: metal-sensitive transcriptional regulator [Patescibacteria group bacterium]|nr:metal-sensitive transcriptional regulator [Patescibacteria group bacterium]